MGVIQNQPDFNETKLNNFINGIEALREKGIWTKDDIIKLYLKSYLILLIKRLENIWIRGCDIPYSHIDMVLVKIY